MKGQVRRVLPRCTSRFNVAPSFPLPRRVGTLKFVQNSRAVPCRGSVQLSSSNTETFAMCYFDLRRFDEVPARARASTYIKTRKVQFRYTSFSDLKKEYTVLCNRVSEK